MAWPATVSVPVRDKGSALRATLSVTAPLFTPAAPLVIVIHAAWLSADQVQVACVLTSTLSVSPSDVAVSCDGSAMYVQPTVSRCSYEPLPLWPKASLVT